MVPREILELPERRASEEISRLQEARPACFGGWPSEVKGEVPVGCRVLVIVVMSSSAGVRDGLIIFGTRFNSESCHVQSYFYPCRKRKFAAVS